MTGPAALAAFEQAKALVKAARYDDALAVPMLPSDRTVIETRIEQHRANCAASAKGTAVQQRTD